MLGVGRKEAGAQSQNWNIWTVGRVQIPTSRAQKDEMRKITASGTVVSVQ